MNEKEVKLILLYKLDTYCSEVLDYNKKFNLISKSTIDSIWDRHVLDSAQLVKFIDFNDDFSLSDLGTGAGFPGIVIAIFNNNPKFHVKLYEKSRVKTKFLISLCQKLNIKAKVFDNDYRTHIINSEYVVSRAFKKLEEHIRISREIIRVNHKLIILKGKNAKNEIKQLNKNFNYSYSLEKSITSPESKIVIINIKK
jgi:16S rRNA (guanine527-N7)-methyltransferase